MILIPLIYTEALPKGMLNTFLVAPAPPPPPPPPQPVVKIVKAPKIINIQKMVAPTVIPKNIAMVKDEAPVIYTNSGDGVAGGTGNVLGGLIGSGPAGHRLLRSPRPRRVSASEATLRPRLSSIRLRRNIRRSRRRRTFRARSSCTRSSPRMASIQELQYVSGPPLLMKSAMDAVKEWRYKPTHAQRRSGGSGYHD